VESVQSPVGFLPQKELVHRVRWRDQITLREEMSARKTGDAEQNGADSGEAHKRFVPTWEDNGSHEEAHLSMANYN
jgi:hypothetical protein